MDEPSVQDSVDRRAREPLDLQHRRVRVGSVSLHCVVAGEDKPGLPLLLIPGWPQTWFAWRKVIQSLAVHRTVVAVDPRGIGDSDRPPAGYDTGTVGGELVGLMQALGHIEFDVAGHDIGMWIAYAMAADTPSAVRRLVMIDAIMPGVSDPPPFFPSSGAAPWLFHFSFNRATGINDMLVAGKEREFLLAQFETKSSVKGAIDEDALEVYMRTYGTPGGMRGGFAHYEALDETIQQNRLRSSRRLAQRVLAVGGQFGRGDRVGQDMERLAFHVQCHVLAGVGHYVPEEAPALLARLMTEFLSTSQPL